MWAVVLAGCTSSVSSSTQNVVACGEPTPYDNATFAALTANAWDQDCGGGPLPPTCNHVTLAADGTYDWTAVSDVVERDQHGAWNFNARTDSSGIVCLDNGAVLPYQLGSSLTFGRLALSPGASLRQSGARPLLASFDAAPIYAQMSGRTWTKTNHFDLGTLAQEMTLVRDGSYMASYRDGACTHGGAWGIDLDPRTTGPAPVVIDYPDPNTCDLRGPTSAQLPSVDVPRVDAAGRLILFSSQYRSGGDPRPWFSYDGYSDGVATSGYLDTDLAASAPTTFDLDFENRDTRTKSLATLTVRATPLVLVSDGYQSTGPTVQLASSAVSGVLDQGAHSSLSITVAPAFSGDALLELELDYSDSTQSYQSRGDFIVTIAP